MNHDQSPIRRVLLHFTKCLSIKTRHSRPQTTSFGSAHDAAGCCTGGQPPKAFRSSKLNVPSN